MPHQLIYTSAPRGLQAGRSGYCTVARSRDLRERLILPIEQYSNYTHLVLPGQEATVRNPTIHLYRKHAISGKEYRILSRIVDAGADHTGRSNFVAHHLIFEDGWRGLPSPAVILRYWRGWKERWDGDPTYIDEISPDEFRTLGQAEGIPTAANDTYLEKGWDTPFTTYLQDGDSQADFEWMGTRDDPDPPKKIAELFGSDSEEQSKTLEKIPGVISAPGGDETRLLDVFAYALGRRSQAAEQEALGQVRESLDNEFRAIKQLSERIEGTVVEVQGKVDAYRQQYEARCETGDASRLYQNCLADYIKPAERRTESAKAKSQDIIEKAQAEHQAAKSQLESGQSPAIGINPGYQNDLREIANGLAQTNHELTGGIQEFGGKLNEHNRVEQLRLEKEREERRKAVKIQLTHRGTPVGTEADFARVHPGARSAKPKREVLAIVIILVVALIIAVGVLIVSSIEPDNPILYAGKETDNTSRHRSYHVNKGSTDAFYAFNDTGNILHDGKHKWSSIKSDKRVKLIKETYGKTEGALTIIEKRKDKYSITIAEIREEILNNKEAAAGAVKTLKELHNEKFFSRGVKMKETYAAVKICYENEVLIQPQEEDNESLKKLRGLPGFVIDGSTEEEQLERWNKVHSEARSWVKRQDYTAAEEEEADYAKIEEELGIWIKLIKKVVREHVGELPENYRKVGEIRGEDVGKIKGWVDAYKIWEKTKNDLVAKLKPLPEHLTKDDINIDLDEKFRITTGETPDDYKSKIVKENNYALDLKSKKNLYENRTVDQILARLGPPTRPARNFREDTETKWEYDINTRTLILHFGPNPNLPVGTRADFVVLTVELVRAN
jgi:hypothetical protein